MNDFSILLISIAPVGILLFFIVFRSIIFPGSFEIPDDESKGKLIRTIKTGGGMGWFNFPEGYLTIHLYENGIVLIPVLGKNTWAPYSKLRMENFKYIMNLVNIKLIINSEELMVNLSDDEKRIFSDLINSKQTQD